MINFQRLNCFTHSDKVIAGKMINCHSLSEAELIDQKATTQGSTLKMLM